MRVRTKTLAAGPGGVHRPGDIREVADDEGKRLVDGGFAETAAVAAPENAAMRTKAPPRHIGGGYFELADGSRVRGKAAALEAAGG